MQLSPNEIQIWSTDLTITPEQESEKLAVLSDDEIIRANHFRFPIHRQRFISARSTLRQILSLYLNIAPNKIKFSYTEHKKPLLCIPHDAPLRFNLAHSHNMAAYAFTLHHAIGVDIEKIKEEYNHSIAERYFSSQENKRLNHLSDQEKIIGFYRIWSRKEAMIKAVGKGLTIPLSTFSVSINDEYETIMLENEKWTLLPLFIHPDYQAAVASNQIIKSISYWSFLDHIPKLEKISAY